MQIGIVIFTVESRVFKFKEPLMLEIEYEEGEICLKRGDLGLSGCGASFSECEKIIREQLIDLWTGFALAPDKELKTKTLAFKNKLLAMADEVK